MKKLWMYALVALVAIAALSCAAASAEEFLGMTAPDLTVTDIRGEEFTLSQALAEKDMVLVNFWATWCPPCRMEFPYLEAAYQAYSDRVGVIALSVEPTDTTDVLIDFADEMGLSFPIANGTDLEITRLIAPANIPTSIVVDRNGVICYCEAGALVEDGLFERLFDAFIGEDYAESKLLTSIPAAKPSVDYADAEALSLALNAEGSALEFENVEGLWPMLPVEEGARKGAMSTNAGRENSTAAVQTSVEAKEGDALSFDYRTSTEPVRAALRVYVDGERVKTFTGEHAWSSYALPLSAGAHTVLFQYEKGSSEFVGEDMAAIGNVALLSGEDALGALAANAALPVADALRLTIVSPDAQRVVFEDPGNVLWSNYACDSFWIIPSARAKALLTVPEGVDPEEAFLYSNFDGSLAPLSAAATSEGYTFESGVDSLETTGYAASVIYYYPSMNAKVPDDLVGAMCFASEDAVRQLVESYTDYGYRLSWSVEEAKAQATEYEGAYAVKFVNAEGKGVQGCIVNFCSDTVCTPVVSDESGVALFEGEEDDYHLQVIVVPEGYALPEESTLTLPLRGQAVEVVLEAAQ
ncbi:MAG: redoxin family protein [Clostridia bacterium]|nr:redoxin family protein [Clostridia bacterium]